MDKFDIKSLKKRYLVWFYKTTKEALDKIDRKFTQIDIDKFILDELKKEGSKKKLRFYIDEFDRYIHNKQNSGLDIKYENKELKPEYEFLALKLKAIEKSIVKELGKSALVEIKRAYEEEMIKRILAERENKI
ncbi:MAG: hypothetical protein KJ880_06490 [Candidatus Omnitrophica bacterium]|nr:hypothetical protein [Candidatus Omnitrophota bacterium]MBU1869090.1 hypothetical protein [Candidatus Omnitrophota bacterium]